MSRLPVRPSKLGGVALVMGALALTACGDDRTPAGLSDLSGAGGTTGTGDPGGGGAGGVAAGGGGASSDSESCFDGVDNDGDQAVDCLDDDCADACGAGCSNTQALTDPAHGVTGDTTGHANDEQGSCGESGSGGEVVYQVTAAQTGMIDVRLRSDADLMVSLRTTCGEPSTELSCANHVATADGLEVLSAPVAAGDSLFVVVEGATGAAAGAYELVEVASRPVACGDGHTDGGEDCDDGKSAGGGCMDDCTIATTESEPNDTAGQADAYSWPWYGVLHKPDDVDLLSVMVPESGILIAKTFDLGDGACSASLMDTELTILGSDGVTVIDFDADSGPGNCSEVMASVLPAGTYYVQVQSHKHGAMATFGYELEIEVMP
ncbi:MAG: pre-peptidase C-terminal domain-containing protein [Deltaproteobacteria bacterium]|nr:pre-peptidase C-terminal domain-containing protein [Deltaproteobacteria bacterium]